MEEEDERINIDDLVDSVDEEDIKDIVADVASKNALVVYVMQPPAVLKEREAEIWRETIDAVTPGHLSDKDIQMLSNYCRCIAEIEFCDEQIEKIVNYANFDPLDANYYKAYTKWSEQRLKAEAMSLRMATAMRLTNQAFRVNKSVDTVTQKTNALWNFDGEEE